MYTVLDLHYIKRDSDGLLFTKYDQEYEEYVDYLVANDTYIPAVADAANIGIRVGLYKKKRCFFPYRKQSYIDKRILNLQSNIKRERGLIIEKLCKEVINYITGRNDQLDIDPTAMLSVHGDVLQLLQQNRYTSAKELIQSKVPDEHISADEISYILNDIYPLYEVKIQELV